MYTIYKTKAIVLSLSEYSDSCLIATLWTRDFGKIYARIQSGRKHISKIAGHTQVGNIITTDLIHGQYSWRLIGASTDISIFDEIRSRNLKPWLSILSHIRMFSHQSPSTGLFDQITLLRTEIGKLSNGKGTSLELLGIVLVLADAGYWPQNPWNKDIMDMTDIPLALKNIEKNKDEIQNQIHEIVVGSYV